MEVEVQGVERTVALLACESLSVNRSVYYISLSHLSSSDLPELPQQLSHQPAPHHLGLNAHCDVTHPALFISKGPRLPGTWSSVQVQH